MYFLPFIAIDAVTVSLLVIAAVPWLGYMFRSLEVPGLGKVEYQELVRTGVAATRAGLTAPPTKKQSEWLPPSAERDPLLALAGLRIEIEKRLRLLADLKAINIGQRPGSIRMLADLLSTNGIVTADQAHALTDMAGTLNRAVHAQTVSPESARWALTVGPTVLASLDARISKIKQQGD